jgi:hypothetical protein
MNCTQVGPADTQMHLATIASEPPEASAKTGDSFQRVGGRSLLGFLGMGGVKTVLSAAAVAVMLGIGAGSAQAQTCGCQTGPNRVDVYVQQAERYRAPVTVDVQVGSTTVIVEESTTVIIEPIFVPAINIWVVAPTMDYYQFILNNRMRNAMWWQEQRLMLGERGAFFYATRPLYRPPNVVSFPAARPGYTTGPWTMPMRTPNGPMIAPMGRPKGAAGVQVFGTSPAMAPHYKVRNER